MIKTGSFISEYELDFFMKKYAQDFNLAETWKETLSTPSGNLQAAISMLEKSAKEFSDIDSAQLQTLKDDPVEEDDFEAASQILKMMPQVAQASTSEERIDIIRKLGKEYLSLSADEKDKFIKKSGIMDNEYIKSYSKLRRKEKIKKLGQKISDKRIVKISVDVPGGEVTPEMVEQFAKEGPAPTTPSATTPPATTPPATTPPAPAAKPPVATPTPTPTSQPGTKTNWFSSSIDDLAKSLSGKGIKGLAGKATLWLGKGVSWALSRVFLLWNVGWAIVYLCQALWHMSKLITFADTVDLSWYSAAYDPNSLDAPIEKYKSNPEKLKTLLYIAKTSRDFVAAATGTVGYSLRSIWTVILDSGIIALMSAGGAATAFFPPLGAAIGFLVGAGIGYAVDYFIIQSIESYLSTARTEELNAKINKIEDIIKNNITLATLPPRPTTPEVAKPKPEVVTTEKTTEAPTRRLERKVERFIDRMTATEDELLQKYNGRPWIATSKIAGKDLGVTRAGLYRGIHGLDKDAWISSDGGKTWKLLTLNDMANLTNEQRSFYVKNIPNYKREIREATQRTRRGERLRRKGLKIREQEASRSDRKALKRDRRKKVKTLRSPAPTGTEVIREETPTLANTMLDDLVKLANYLDILGLNKEADELDLLLLKISG